MLRLLSKPLLPESKIKTVFMSGKNNEFISVLSEDYDIDVIKAGENKNLDKQISDHADCNLVQIENTFFISDLNYKNKIVNYLTSKSVNTLNNINIDLISDVVKSPYPDDVKLNVKTIGNSIICNSDYISTDIKRFITDKQISIIHANQGYSACSSIVLNNNALITDDESIYRSSIRYGIDTLLISKGSVKLNGYDYGFIGGTCGMIDKNLLAFTGNLSMHTDYVNIIAFFNKYNIDYVELRKGPLIDIGGIIPLFEYC